MSKKVLLCEDHPINAQIALAMLEKLNASAVLAQNGEEGVKLFSDSGVGEFSAVLMDLNMPVMNGFEAAKAIRALDRVDAKIVPIIALSASNDPEDIGKALEAGMDTHILKPLDPKALAKMLCLDLPSGK
jgi:CheY-like chemotaxis protein